MGDQYKPRLRDYVSEMSKGIRESWVGALAYSFSYGFKMTFGFLHAAPTTSRKQFESARKVEDKTGFDFEDPDDFFYTGIGTVVGGLSAATVGFAYYFGFTEIGPEVFAIPASTQSLSFLYQYKSKTANLTIE